MDRQARLVLASVELSEAALLLVLHSGIRMFGAQGVALLEAACAEVPDRMVSALAVHYELRHHSTHDGGQLESVSAESGRPV